MVYILTRPNPTNREYPNMDNTFLYPVALAANPAFLKLSIFQIFESIFDHPDMDSNIENL